MSQYRWTFYNPVAGEQHLGLYHGDDSGHLMVYLNNDVILVDFNVMSSRSYTIIINEEIVKIQLNKNSIGFSYSLERTHHTTSSLSPLMWVKNLFSLPFS